MFNQEIANIAGKNFIVYSPKSEEIITPSDISQFLRKFQLNKALELIGKVSNNIFEDPKPFKSIQGVPISNSSLAYVAMKLIEVSNDYRSHNMTINDLAAVHDMYFSLSEPLYEDDEGAPYLIRQGMHQFDFDREKRNSLPRTLAIYRDLWSKADPNKIDIDESIYRISGLHLEEALFLSYYFYSIANLGSFQIFENLEDSNRANKKFTSTLSLSNRKSFIDWVSCNYKTFREMNQSQPARHLSYDRYRFNNLSSCPIVLPDRKLIQGDPQTYIVPVTSLLYERVSRGLYHDLTSYFSQPGNGNRFRDSFGYVFQRYVGTLLRETVEYAEILEEWKYAKPNKMTSDWIVIRDEKAILVEVKQSGLHLQAKSWGELDTIKSDLKKSIGSAVNQLWKFEIDIRSGKYDTLRRLNNCKTIERLIVTHDRSYFLNSILRDLIREFNTDIPKGYIWHVVSVEELERILGLTEVTLFEILEEKRQDPDGITMDFRDYISRKYKSKAVKNQYLDTIQLKFFNEFGMSMPGLAATLEK